MPLEDFTHKRWKVSRAEEGSPCELEEKVIIIEQPEKVVIQCGDKTFDGWYDRETNTIQGEDDRYVIQLQITFTPKGGHSSGGSWTAEDHGPWHGDG